MLLKHNVCISNAMCCRRHAWSMNTNDCNALKEYSNDEIAKINKGLKLD